MRQNVPHNWDNYNASAYIMGWTKDIKITCFIATFFVARSDKSSLLQLSDSTLLLDFWGPASNFGIPIAALLDTQKSPDL